MCTKLCETSYKTSQKHHSWIRLTSEHVNHWRFRWISAPRKFGNPLLNERPRKNQKPPFRHIGGGSQLIRKTKNLLSDTSGVDPSSSEKPKISFPTHRGWIPANPKNQKSPFRHVEGGASTSFFDEVHLFESYWLWKNKILSTNYHSISDMKHPEPQKSIKIQKDSRLVGTEGS